MPAKSHEEEVVAARTMHLPGGVRLFRQAGGCLEITQEDTEYEDDIVHVCADQIGHFMDELRPFIDRTPPLQCGAT